MFGILDGAVDVVHLGPCGGRDGQGFAGERTVSGPLRIRQRGPGMRERDAVPAGEPGRVGQTDHRDRLHVECPGLPGGVEGGEMVGDRVVHLPECQTDPPPGRQDVRLRLQVGPLAAQGERALHERLRVDETFFVEIDGGEVHQRLRFLMPVAGAAVHPQRHREVVERAGQVAERVLAIPEVLQRAGLAAGEVRVPGEVERGGMLAYGIVQATHLVQRAAEVDEGDRLTSAAARQ